MCRVCQRWCWELISWSRRGEGARGCQLAVALVCWDSTEHRSWVQSWQKEGKNCFPSPGAAPWAGRRGGISTAGHLLLSLTRCLSKQPVCVCTHTVNNPVVVLAHTPPQSDFTQLFDEAKHLWIPVLCGEAVCWRPAVTQVCLRGAGVGPRLLPCSSVPCAALVVCHQRLQGYSTTNYTWYSRRHTDKNKCER